MTFPNTLTVTVVATTTTPDALGDATATQVRTPVDGVLFAPRSSEERTNPQAPAVYAAASLYFTEGLPAGVTLNADDAVEITGVSPLVDGTYEIEGLPGYWGGPVEVAVIRTGAV